VRALELSGADRASAEELAQEAFARTLVHWARVRTGANPAGYVFTTAFRLLRRTWRRPRTAVLVDEPAASADVAGEAVTVVAVERALRALPARRRACAVLCFVVGLSPKEAARALGIAEGTVRKQLELARDGLRGSLDEGGGSGPQGS